MKISLNWLREFVELPKNIKPSELAEKLSLHVVEVKGWEEQGKGLEGVVVGEVLEFHKHPDADKLHVAQIGIGRDKPLQLIFGQMVKMNVGDRIPVAVAPTTLPTGAVIEKKPLRGVLSEGMLCLEQELGFKESGVSILYFPTTKPGTPIAEALGLNDIIFEISNVSLSNRPDLWSHYGIAREVAAMYGKKLKPLSLGKRLASDEKKYAASVKIQDNKLCPRYIGAVVENIAIAPSPLWLQQRLQAIGQRPINNIVDITNYVMFEVGEPTHAFDIAKLTTTIAQGDKLLEIVVRGAEEGETITTLDGQTRKLGKGMLLITNEKKPVAIAGVMGGADSEVDDTTKAIFLEVANFDPVSIRLTSQKLGLRTEGSMRWEKGVDPHLAEWGMRRMLALIREIMPQARVVSPIVDVGSWKRTVKSIAIPEDFIVRRIGASVPGGKVKKILQSLDFRVQANAKEWKVTPPSWRATRDISLPEDIVEEIGRHLDYNTIPDALPSFPIAPPQQSAHHRLERALRQFLAGAGFYEVAHKPFINPSAWERFGLENGTHVEVMNPVDPDARYLRQSLLPGLLDDIRTNRNEADTLKFFEWGRVFTPHLFRSHSESTAQLTGAARHNAPHNETSESVSREDAGFAPQDGEYAVKKNAKEHLPRQPVTLSFVVCETMDAEEMLRRVKGIALRALQAAGYQGEIKAAPEAHAAFRTETVFSLFANGVHVGGGSIANEALKAELGVAGKQNIGVVSIDIDALATVKSSVKRFSPLPAYPAIQRDLAIVVDEAVNYADIEKTVRSAAGSLLESLELFDVFRGEGISQAKKSLALRLTFRAAERTLKGEEADKGMKNVIVQLQQKHQVSVRE